MNAPDDTLTPPAGAIYGRWGDSLGPYPTSLTWDDDKTIAGGTQYASGQANSETWVYWVDADMQDCRYVIIQRLTGTFSPGTVLANTPASRGFFQHGVAVTTRLEVPAGTSAQLRASTPQTFTPSPANPDAPIDLRLPMMLLLSPEGDFKPTEFDATETGSVRLSGWGVSTLSPDPLTLTTWFHQVAVPDEQGRLVGWDPAVHAPQDWPRWYTRLYDDAGNTLAPPDQSRGNLQFELLVAWEIRAGASVPIRPDVDPRPKPVSLPVKLTVSFRQDLAAFHNPAGCNTVFHGDGSVPIINGAFHIHPIPQAHLPFVWEKNLAAAVHVGPAQPA